MKELAVVRWEKEDDKNQTTTENSQFCRAALQSFEFVQVTLLLLSELGAHGGRREQQGEDG